MPVMDVASGAFYTSGTFWAGAGTVAGLLGTAAIVWVTLTVGFPRRRLTYWLRAAASLLTAPQGMRSDLELRRRTATDGSPGEPDGPGSWQVLADPRVMTIDLTSHGRWDIPSDAYDKGDPLQLDTGAPIVEILQTTSSQASRPAPPVTADGTLLSIGPGLIGKHQEITITVLTDGGRPALALHKDPFIDVQVRQRAQETFSTPTRLLLVVLMVVVAAVTVWAEVTAVPTATSAGKAAAAMLAATWVTVLAALLWTRRSGGRPS
jgi:hypothetical protein